MIVKRQKDAAAVLGVTARQLREWEKEPWWPEHGRSGGGYDVGAIREARDAVGRKGSDESGEARRLKLGRDAARLKQDRIKIERMELDLAAARREVVPRGAVELHFSEFLTRFGDWADQFPDLAKRQVPKKYGPKLRRWMAEQLDEFRRRLAEELEAAAREWDRQVEE